LVISNGGSRRNSKYYGKYKEGQRTTKVDMGGGGKKRLEGLECLSDPCAEILVYLFFSLFFI
jgi:hypothetical protein